ncbi:MAG: hypothetical protein LUI87_09820, partial [Lachnospiraceae bacterium]|nr:hypothetical protein [Lachnospiraceae bacterium]
MGFNMTASGADSISIGGDDTYSDANKSIAIGTGAEIDSNPAGDKNIGSIAFGFYANASHENSIAIGMGSSATDDNQVNLGYYKLKGNSPDTSSTYYGRSLAGISSIDFTADEDGNKGAITGVTTINGANFTVDKTNSNIAIGVLAKIVSGEQGVALGHEASVEGTGGVAVGSGAKTYDESGTALGFWAEAFRKDSIAIGSGAQGAGENSVAIGSNSKTIAADNSVAIGFAAHAADAINSIVIGTGSYTERDNQVNFGYYKLNADGIVDTMSTYYGRSLAGISSIDFIADEYGNKGAITGLTSINGVAVSGSADAGLTVGGITFNNGGIMGEVTEYNYKMKINGIDLYTGISERWDKGSMAFGKDAEIAAYTGATSFNAMAIGTRAIANGDNAIAIGAYSTAYTEDNQPEGNAIAIGTNARSISANSIAFGYQTYANQNTGNSMALGAYSSVDASDTVSFGHKVGDGYGDAYPSKTYTDNLFRSLVNVKDIELNTADDGTGGAITGVTSINGAYFSAATDQSHLLIGSDERTSTNKKNTGIGISSIADGDSTVAVGYEAIAAEGRSIAIGASSKAYADDSIVIGEGSEITNTGLGSIALGRGTKVVSQNSIAIGNRANISDESQVYSVAIGADSTTSKAKQVSFGHKKDDLDAGGSSFGDDLFRSVVNVADIEMHGGITGLTSIEGVAVSGSADAGLTVSGVTLNGGKVNEVALGLKGGTDTDKDNVLVGGVDVTKMQTDVAGKASQTAFDTLNETVTNSTTGLVKQITDIDVAYKAADTALSDKATALEAKTSKFKADGSELTGMTSITSTGATLGGVSFADSGIVTGVSSINTVAFDASGNITGGTYNGMTLGNDKVNGVTLGTDGTVNGTAITSDSFNGVSIKSDGTVDGVDVSALKATVEGIKTDGVGTADTKGIERTGDGSGTSYTTSIEVNTKISSSGITTNAITASGTVTANEFVEGSQKLSDKYAAKAALDDYTTTADMNTKFADYATTDAMNTALNDYAKTAEVDTAISTKANADATGLSVENQGKWKAVLGVDTLEGSVATNTSNITDLTGKV